MCGIIGCTGNFGTVDVLLEGLRKLEYRGYDSAGIAVMCSEKIEVVKCKGRIQQLDSKLEGSDFSICRTGIGHTRWATHGEPNDINSHPHVSDSGLFCVVHNGIIENYTEVRANLKKEGYAFLSETDSEVIAHLLEYNYDGDVIRALHETVSQLEGSYALGVMCTATPDLLYSARKDSPLVLGMTENGGLIASDIPALLSHTREIFIAEDGEIACVGSSEIVFYNSMGMRVEKDSITVDWDEGAAEKSDA